MELDLTLARLELFWMDNKGEGMWLYDLWQTSWLLWGFTVTMEKWSFILQGHWYSEPALPRELSEKVLDLCFIQRGSHHLHVAPEHLNVSSVNEELNFFIYFNLSI